MEDYSINQIKRMEQEATRRMREMNRLSKPVPEQCTPPAPPSCPPKSSPPPASPKKKKGAFSFLNALDLKKLIGENSEQAMLLLLVLILSNDNTCDEYLLYALIYIML